MCITSCKVYIILWPCILVKLPLNVLYDAKRAYHWPIFGLWSMVKPNFPTNLGAGLLPCPSKPFLNTRHKKILERREGAIGASFPPLQLLPEFSWDRDVSRKKRTLVLHPFVYKWRPISDRTYRILGFISYPFFFLLGSCKCPLSILLGEDEKKKEQGHGASIIAKWYRRGPSR